MKIITPVVNNPDFIELQYYTLKKYVKGDYEFIVFNDAKEFPDYTNYNDVTMGGFQNSYQSVLPRVRS